MNCPNCRTKITKSTCPQCKKDLSLHVKIMNMSISNYNSGLEAVQEQNLSAGEKFLKGAIFYDKDCVLARNLLGLLYYRKGEIGEALKHWVISASLQKNENVAKKYVEMTQKDSKETDRMNEAISLFNEALRFSEKGSDDLAIIRLRKAVDLSPNFVEGLNLLAFSYLKEGRMEDAKKLAEKSLSIDQGNEKARTYLEVTGRKTENQFSNLTPKRIMSRGLTEALTRPKDLHIKEIIFFALGAILSVGILFYMVVPDMIKEKTKEIEGLESDIQQLEKTHEKEILAFRKNIDDQEKTIDDLEILQETLEKSIENKEAEAKVVDAKRLLDNEAYLEAVLLISPLNTVGFSPVTLELIEEIFTTALPILEKEYYTEGMNLYNQKKYEEAKVFFLKAIEYKAIATIYADDAYYFLGRMAQIENDGQEAKKYFQIVIDEYPESNQIAQAKRRIEQYE